MILHQYEDHPPCPGMNCGTTTAQHSKECIAEHTAAAAGGDFVKWRSIDSAPTDGTQIMLTNGITVAQGWYEFAAPHIQEIRDIDGRYIDQVESDGFDGWLDCTGGMQPAPIYWQPMLAPPVPNK
jgi:hypothetical protein